jgi:exopolysaccharide biosynthesis polyprenyl glycosylphosphotransferase
MIEQQIGLNTSSAPRPVAGWQRALRLRLSERKLLLFLADLVVVNAALFLALSIGFDLFAKTETLPVDLKWFASLTAVWLACAIFFDVYNLPRASDAEQTLQAVIGAVLLTTLVYTLTPVITPPLFSRGVLLIFLVALMSGMLAWRMLYIRLFGQPWFMQRAIVVDAGPVGQDLVYALRNSEGAPSPYHAAGYSLVGMIDTQLDWRPDGTTNAVAGVPVLGGPHDLLTLVRRLEVDEVIDAITNRHAVSDELFAAMLACHEQGLRVTSMTAFYERVLGRVPVNSIGHHLDDVIQMNDSAGYRLFRVAKRMLDLVMCVPLLLLLAAAIPLVALANALAAPGPLFYTQTRLGRGGKPFPIFKFRSMGTDAEKDGRAVWAQGSDARVTPVGRWLRRTRIDELPQCLNVLRGEMSMIGPRPERPEFVDALSAAIPFYRARHAVRPGVTGWAQVRFRYGSSVDDTRIKLEYDLYYVKHAGPLLDVQIMVRTAAIMLQMKGT